MPTNFSPLLDSVRSCDVFTELHKLNEMREETIMEYRYNPEFLKSVRTRNNHRKINLPLEKLN